MYLINNTESNQDKFIKSNEGIGDILVFETKREKNKLVISGLIKLRQVVEKLVKLKETNTEKFNEIVFLKKGEPGSEFAVGFLSPINQFVRVYNAAIESQNAEISRYSIYQIAWILQQLSSEPDNDFYINSLLIKLVEITKMGIKKKDDSAFIAAIQWYTDIVFHNTKFNTSYLRIFNNFFLSDIKYIIDENQADIFNKLVSSLIDGINIPLYPETIWSYAQIGYDTDYKSAIAIDNEYHVNQRVNELESLRNQISTNEGLALWEEKFDELRDILEKYWNRKQLAKARTLESEIKESVVSRYKFNSLIDIIFIVGAYCLYREKYTYIKELWECKQPHDSDLHWIGHNIIPENVNSFLNLYIKCNEFSREYRIGDGHHGSSIYLKKYYVLLLLRLLKNVRPNEKGDFPLPQVTIPNMTVSKLRTLELDSAELLEYASSIKGDTQLLSTLGFDRNSTKELFDLKLVPFIEMLSETAKNQIQERYRSSNISNTKVDEFIEKVINKFNENSIMRHIFADYLKLYQDKTGSDEDSFIELDRFGISIVDDKGGFLDDWYVFYSGWGDNYGSQMASGENRFLLDCLVKKTETFSDSFIDVLSKFENPDDLIILTTHYSFWNYFKDDSNYTPEWHSNCKPLDIPGFAGWYNFKNTNIPVFEVYQNYKSGSIFVLKKSLIRNLVQYSPQDSIENTENIYNIFSIKVRSFSEDLELLNAYLNDPPHWLDDYETREEKKKYLQTRVLIQIYERFEYKGNENILGYRFNSDDEITNNNEKVQ